jgi:hypothetical protein
MNNGAAAAEQESRRIGVTAPSKYNRYTAYFFHPVTKKSIYIGTFASAEEAAQARWRFLQSLPSNVRSRVATNYEPQRSNYVAVRNTREPYNYMYGEKDAASRPSAALSPPTVIAPTYNPFADMMNEEPAATPSAPAVPAGLDGGRRRRRRRVSTRSRKLTLKTRRGRDRKHR